MSEQQKQNKKPSHLEKLEAYLRDQQQRVTIDDTDVNSAFISQAPSYLAACVRYHKAQEVLQKQKLNYDKVVAEVDFEIRNSEGKTTEAFISQSIKKNERVVMAKNMVIQAEYQSSCYQSVVRAWEQKKDMLIQVGSDQRREYNAQVSVNRPGNRDGNVAPRRVNGRETEL